jgi:hypothetical protein
MNEDQKKSPIVTSFVGGAIPKTEDHPLHILDNQVDPEKKSVGQKPIRTYESDVAEALARKKTSVMTMAVAEGQKKTGTSVISNKPSSDVGKKVFIAVISLVFIAGGVIGGYYLYLKSPLSKPQVVAVQKNVPSIISPDTQKIVKISSIKKEQLFKGITDQFKNLPVNEGKISEFILTYSVGSSTNRVLGSDFVNNMDFTMSDMLKRAITDRWMTGVYSVEGENIPFIILTTDFFQNSYSGMLRWEPNMAEELADLLDFRYKSFPEPVTEAASSTASTTDTVRTPSYALFNLRGNFKDKVISNRDTRQFISSNGNMLFLYTFIDKENILVTTSERVIPAILERIEKQTYVR